MRPLFLFMFLSSAILFYSCCTCKDSSSGNKELQSINQGSPTSIVVNLSIVNATVKELVYRSETDYHLKVIVNEVLQTDAYPSIAIAGNEYELIPNFRYNGVSLIDNDINEELIELGKISVGKEFKAEISLNNQKRWIIQKVLSIR